MDAAPSDSAQSAAPRADDIKAVPVRHPGRWVASLVILAVAISIAQAEQVFANIDRVLRAAGSSIERVFKATIYLTDMRNFPKIVELRKRWGEPYPADTIVEVRSLALPALEIEIDVVALAGDGRIIG